MRSVLICFFVLAMCPYAASSEKPAYKSNDSLTLANASERPANSCWVFVDGHTIRLRSLFALTEIVESNHAALGASELMAPNPSDLLFLKKSGIGIVGSNFRRSPAKFDRGGPDYRR